jgi:hypothetical protein
MRPRNIAILFTLDIVGCGVGSASAPTDLMGRDSAVGQGGMAARPAGPDGNSGALLGGMSGTMFDAEEETGGADTKERGAADAAIASDVTAVNTGQARVVAYVNCLCGFGAGATGGFCLSDPDPLVNQVKAWEDRGESPMTHYVISFLSFSGLEIQTDPGSIWRNGGGSTSDFELAPGLRAAMQSAQAHGKKVLVSLGGESGSTGFLAWWSAQGATTDARVAGMRARMMTAVAAFELQNDVTVDGIDVDIELGGAYSYGSDKYQSTRDLINAIPDDFISAFVPQVGNGLCAAPVEGDPLPPTITLGGQCMNPVNGDDSPWALARLDQDCVRADGRRKLDYWGIQYYNAGQAQCCGGGADVPGMIESTAQNYVNLANGWAAAGDIESATNPWHAYQYFPGPWAAFQGLDADRLVLGKPGCQGCAGSDYLGFSDVVDLIGRLDGRLTRPMGGLLFWDLCRLFGGVGPQCVSGQCQPSWGASDALTNLAALRAKMRALTTR